MDELFGDRFFHDVFHLEFELAAFLLEMSIHDPVCTLQERPLTFSRVHATLHPALSVCLSVHHTLLFGQRPRRGRSPVEHRGNLSVRTSVRPSPPQLHPQGFVSFGAQI